jgi:hypothetical protein
MAQVISGQSAENGNSGANGYSEQSGQSIANGFADQSDVEARQVAITSVSN